MGSLFFKDLTLTDFCKLSQSEELIFSFYVEMNTDYSESLLQDLKNLSDLFKSVPFILLDDSLKKHLHIPTNPKSKLTCFIFRRGYMMFFRENTISYDDLKQAFKFAAHISMDLWIAEDLRFKLSCSGF